MPLSSERCQFCVRRHEQTVLLQRSKDMRKLDNKARGRRPTWVSAVSHHVAREVPAPCLTVQQDLDFFLCLSFPGRDELRSGDLQGPLLTPGVLSGVDRREGL